MDKLTSWQANKLLVRKTEREDGLDRVIIDRVTKGKDTTGYEEDRVTDEQVLGVTGGGVRQNDIMTNKEWHIFSHREYRWTERTNFHRDIKSTDITERYS